jgi:hypothetical protein
MVAKVCLANANLSAVRLWLQDPKSVCWMNRQPHSIRPGKYAGVDRLHSWLDGSTAIIATHRVPDPVLTGSHYDSAKRASDR